MADIRPLSLLDSLSIPTPQQEVADSNGFPTQVWWQFWQRLLRRTAATISYTIETGIVATGSTQSDAYALTAEASEITTTPLNAGVLLFGFGAGLFSIVWNVGVNDLDVYPPSGGSIDGAAVNAPYVLAAGKAQIFFQLTATTFRSLQLG